MYVFTYMYAYVLIDMYDVTFCRELDTSTDFFSFSREAKHLVFFEDSSSD